MLCVCDDFSPEALQFVAKCWPCFSDCFYSLEQLPLLLLTWVLLLLGLLLLGPHPIAAKSTPAC